MKIKNFLLRQLRRGVNQLGISNSYLRKKNSQCAAILMYHSVPSSDIEPWVHPSVSIPQAQFEQQMRFLAKNRLVISLTELERALRDKRPLKPGTVVLTFDDGYLDNLTVVAPILQKYGLPATLFLATEYIEKQQSQWLDVLHGMVQSRTCHLLSLPDLGINSVDLRSAGAARKALHKIRAHLLKSDYERRDGTLQEIARQLASSGALPRLTLSWQDVGRLLREFPNFSLGAHTRNHIDLTKKSAMVIRNEVRESISDIEERTGTKVQHFSYPYGRFDSRCRRAIKSSTCTAAVETGTGRLVDHEADLFSLPRIEVNRSSENFSLLTSGASTDDLHALIGYA